MMAAFYSERSLGYRLGDDCHGITIHLAGTQASFVNWHYDV